MRLAAEDANVLCVKYEDLDIPDACADIFEHCLPYKFDRKWWASLKYQNVQMDVKEHLLYYFVNKDAIEGFKRHCKSELTRLAREGRIMKRSA